MTWAIAKFTKLKEVSEALNYIVAKEVEQSKQKIEKLVELARIRHELEIKRSKRANPQG